MAQIINISAVYNGKKEVPIGTDINSLNITVTANYDDGMIENINNYELSGSISAGENEVVVRYNDFTTTFNVFGYFNQILLKNKNGQDETYYNIKTVTLDTPTFGVKETFTRGSITTLEPIELNFFDEENNIVLNSLKIPEEEWESFKNIEIKKPKELIAKNIKEGVTIAGIVGECSAPTLNPLEVTLNDTIITATNPTTNGNFVTAYEVYINGEFLKEVPYSSSSTTINVYELFKESGEYSIIIQPKATGFQNVEIDPIVINLYAIIENEEISTDDWASTNTYGCILEGKDLTVYYGDSYKDTETLTYLPEEIEVTMNGEPCEYTWDGDRMYDIGTVGEMTERAIKIQQYGILTVPNVTGDVNINIPVLQNMKIHKPKVNQNNGNVLIEIPKYATAIKYFMNNEEIYKHEFASWNFSKLYDNNLTIINNVNFNFAILQDNDYGLGRLTINALEDIKLTLACFNYVKNSSDSTLGFGLLSNLNTSLSKSYSVDSSSSIYKNFSGSSTKGIQRVSYEIPAGSYFIDIKDRNGKLNTAGGHIFGVAVERIREELIPVIKGVEALSTYGNYELELCCSANFYDDSDRVPFTYINQPVISYSSRKITIDNILKNINQVDVYIDNVLYTSLELDGSNQYEIDLNEYAGLKESKIYINVIGDDYNWTSETITTNLTFDLEWSVESVPGASYGFIKNSSTGYYVSQNKGYSSSYALCKVILKAPVAMKVNFNCINYAEANYDYGILSNLNTTLGLSSSADSSSSIYKSFKGSSMSTVQTVTYDIPAGEHFIYVKFIKNGSTNSNNDTLQFTVNQASFFDQTQSGTELIVAGFNTIKQINNQIEVK